MDNFELISFDMDGTLLDSQKRISPSSIEMIKKASDAGKIVILSTGRCLSELQPYLKILPEIQYIISVSGALVYDLVNKNTIFSQTISVPTVHHILHEAADFDLMIHLLSHDSIVQKNKIGHMKDYHMGIYQTMFEEITIQPKDIFDYYKNKSVPLYKINFYMKNQHDRSALKKRIQSMQLTIVDAEHSSLECTAQNVSKAVGLKKLCDHLQISMEKTIAVGDADNDFEILSCAGLSVAMGNATQSIKNIADVTVHDNDHDGCAYAIMKYLL